jgi:hypothetical protein
LVPVAGVGRGVKPRLFAALTRIECAIAESELKSIRGLPLDLRNVQTGVKRWLSVRAERLLARQAINMPPS